MQRFTHAGRELVNVIARRAGELRRQIVIVAARDAAVVPEATGSAADTAALLELARVFEGRPSRKTLVLASVDGSNLGEVGTSRLLSELAGQGMAILMISSELPEVLGMADRVLVVCEGRITAELSREEATPERVMHAATASVHHTAPVPEEATA